MKKFAKDIDDLNKYDCYCTVKELLGFIKEYKISPDSKVLVQRVEDVYFENHGWGTVKKEGQQSSIIKELVNRAKSGVYADKEQFPKMTGERIAEILDYENKIDETRDEYIPVWCPVKYKDDNNLYLDLHY